MFFNKDYYKNVCAENNYTDENNEFVPYGYDYFYNVTDSTSKQQTLITAGYGMNNSPHIMTALQMNKIVQLQKAGYNTQIVLGDYDVMLARNFNEASVISEKYKAFASALGYDTKKGCLRTQTDDIETLSNVVMLSSGLNDEDFDYVKEDLLDYYNTNIKLSFSTKVSIVLMLSDFITPLMQNKYSKVIAVSGIDESKYAVLADRLIKRLNIDGSVGGMFTGIVGGLNGHPKMSKSKPESGIFLSDSRETIKQKIADSITCDLNSVVFQLAINSNTSFTCNQIEEAFTDLDTDKVNRIIDETIDFIISIAEKWQHDN